MHWTTAGADAIIALRCREASSTWGSHLCSTINIATHCLTRRAPKMILTTYKIDVHPRF